MPGKMRWNDAAMGGVITAAKAGDTATTAAAAITPTICAGPSPIDAAVTSNIATMNTAITAAGESIATDGPQITAAAENAAAAVKAQDGASAKNLGDGMPGVGSFGNDTAGSTF